MNYYKFGGGGHKEFAELPCKVYIPYTNISQAVPLAALMVILEAVAVSGAAVSGLSESLAFSFWLVSVSKT